MFPVSKSRGRVAGCEVRVAGCGLRVKREFFTRTLAGEHLFFREKPPDIGFGCAADAPLGDEPGDQARRCDIEGVVGRGAAFRRHQDLRILPSVSRRGRSAFPPDRAPRRGISDAVRISQSKVEEGRAT